MPSYSLSFFMRVITPLALCLLFLTSCGWALPKSDLSTPYPSIPLGSTNIELAPAIGWDFVGTWTEPFWGINITASGVEFSRPNESGITVKSYETRQEKRDGMVVIKDAKWEFFVNLTKWVCSDGMSDKKYDYTVTISVGAENLKGCANEKDKTL